MPIGLSVIIPVYNTPAPLLNQCISSIRNSLYLMGEDVEILLINDGSTASHVEPILRETENADNRFKYLFQDNAGVSCARNLGIEKAKGKYVAFIDADDYLEPAALPYMLQTAKRTGLEVVMFGFCRSDEDTKERTPLKQHYQVSKDIIQSLISNNMERWYSCGTNLASVWAKIYKRECLLSNHLSFIQDIAPNEDGFFNLCLLTHIPEFYVDNTIVYHYVIYDGSAIHKFSNHDIRVGKIILPMLEEKAHVYGLDEVAINASLSYRALKVVMSATHSYFTHPQNTKSFWELKAEIDNFLSDSSIKKWIRRYRIKDVRDKSQLKLIVLLKLHVFPIVLILDRWKMKLKMKVNK